MSSTAVLVFLAALVSSLFTLLACVVSELLKSRDSVRGLEAQLLEARVNLLLEARLSGLASERVASELVGLERERIQCDSDRYAACCDEDEEEAVPGQVILPGAMWSGPCIVGDPQYATEILCSQEGAQRGV